MTRRDLALIPRSLDTALLRAQAPTAEGAREPDAALLDAMARELKALRETVRSLTKRVAYLEGAQTL